VLPPENIVSVSRDMEGDREPCATAVAIDLTGGQGNVGGVNAGVKARVVVMQLDGCLGGL
jgi:hypothetical protein